MEREFHIEYSNLGLLSTSKLKLLTDKFKMERTVKMAKEFFSVLWLQHLVLQFLNNKEYRLLRQYMAEKDWDAQFELEREEQRNGVRKWAEEELKRGSCKLLHVYEVSMLSC